MGDRNIISTGIARDSFVLGLLLDVVLVCFTRSAERVKLTQKCEEGGAVK
jgi:hypothetical protein